MVVSHCSSDLGPTQSVAQKQPISSELSTLAPNTLLQHGHPVDCINKVGREWSYGVGLAFLSRVTFHASETHVFFSAIYKGYNL